MKSPFTDKEMKLVQERRTVVFRKEEVSFIHLSYQCEDTREYFTDEELDRINLNMVHNEYRVKHNLPFPEEIKQLRKVYGLSQANMSEIFGFGANVYGQYEQGEVPSKSNGKLIKLAEDPREFYTLTYMCDSIKPSIKDKVFKRKEKLEQEASEAYFDLRFNDYLFGKKQPSIYTGYTVPQMHKVKALVAYLSKSLNPWKTQINKHLFYADFLCFRKHGKSISGMQYVAITLGPVPENYDLLFGHLRKEHVISVNAQILPHGNEGELFSVHPEYSIPDDVFSEEEKEILDTVIRKFRKKNTKWVVDYSHEEKAWIDNESKKQFIPYTYGFSLNDF